jgi:hypothetical protein
MIPTHATHCYIATTDDGIVASFLQAPSSLSRDEWAHLHIRLTTLIAPGKPWLDSYDSCFRLYSGCRYKRIFWHEELAGPRGSSFILYILPGISEEEIDEAVYHIRRTSDVVSLEICRIHRLVDFPELPENWKLAYVAAQLADRELSLPAPFIAFARATFGLPGSPVIGLLYQDEAILYIDEETEPAALITQGWPARLVDFLIQNAHSTNYIRINSAPS